MVQYSEVSAFTETPGMGNGAGVILEAGALTDAEMQRLAAFIGLPESVFVTDVSPGRARVRYFTPTQEIDFCGHATVALGLMLAGRGHWRGEPLHLETLVGTVPLELEVQDGRPHRVWMQQPTLEVRDVPRELRGRIAEALGVNERVFHRGLPLASAYTGLWTTFVPLVDAMVVDSLDPDMDAIRTLSEDLGVTGLHPYAPMGPDRFAARDFAPLVGIPEDPVTGSASGALIALLAERGLIPRRGTLAAGTCYQGHAMGQPGDVSVEVTLERDRASSVRVGGCAVVEREGRHDPRGA